jgi:hypothetical protein
VGLDAHSAPAGEAQELVMTEAEYVIWISYIDYLGDAYESPTYWDWKHWEWDLDDHIRLYREIMIEFLSTIH